MMTSLSEQAYQCQGSSVGAMGTLRRGSASVSGGVPFALTGLGHYSPDGLPSVRAAGGDCGGGSEGLLVFDAIAQTVTASYANSAQSGGNNGRPVNIVECGTLVRRLTPREVERLQGFPDDWTLVPYRGRPAKDGPRYRAVGNAMAVPCVRWLGRRIAMVDSGEGCGQSWPASRTMSTRTII